MSTDQTKQSTPLDQSQPLAAVGDALPSTAASTTSSTESVVDGTKQSEHSQSNSKASEDDEDEEDADDQPVNPLSDDDSDDDADGPAVKDDIQLGFLELALHPRGMLRDYFPCKVGGKPAWLNPKNIPTTQQLTCAHCKNTLTFLMQLYAPLRSTYGSHSGSFHRTLYLFCCPEESCTNQQNSIVCFRSQLPRVNPFYPDVAPPKLKEWPLENDEDVLPIWEDQPFEGTPLCSVCGIHAPSSCSRCHTRRYCSRGHQLWDWKEGGHKNSCVAKSPEEQTAAAASSSLTPSPVPANQVGITLPSILFPQKEVVIEPEDDDESDDESGDKKKSDKPKTKEQELLEAYEQQRQKEREAGEESEDEEDIAEAASSWSSPKLKDPLFLKFKARVESKPEQILRYGRSETAARSQPLWVSTWFQPASEPLPERKVDSKGKPIGPPPKPKAPTTEENDRSIPPCPHCNGPRRFEFQVLPQILFYLGKRSDGLDFANLVVYTCDKSCGDGTQQYFQEYTWIQAHVPEPGLKQVERVYGS